MASLFKPLIMAESGCSSLSSMPTTLFTTKPSSSYAFSKPLNLSHYFSSSWVSLKTKKISSLTPLLVAQTSDWAQQEEEEGEKGQEEGGEVAVAEADTEEFSFGGGEEEISGGEGREEEESYPEPPEEAKLFVGNLPYDVDSESLANLFNDAGVVEVAEVIYNRETDQSRGFGFVTMSTVEEAEKAVDMFHRYELNGRFLTVNKAAPRGSRPERPQRSFAPSFRIYVGNLPWQVDDSRLEQLFSEHGKVVDARVVFDRDSQRSRGFGFVTMSSETEVNDAIAALDGQTLDGRAIRVNVAEDRPRRNSF